MPRLSKKMRKSRKGKKDSRKIMNSEESHLANLIVNNYNKLNKSEEDISVTENVNLEIESAESTESVVSEV